MLAGTHGSDGKRRVRRVGRADADDVDVGIIEQVLRIDVDPTDAELIGSLLCLFPVQIADGDDVARLGISVGVEVHFADSDADDRRP